MGAVTTCKAAALFVILLAYTADLNPLSKAACDLCVTALGVNDAGLVGIKAIVLRADFKLNTLADQIGGDIKALVDIAVLSLLIDLAIGAYADIAQRNALTYLNQGWVAFVGLDLLDATAAAVSAAADDAYLVAAVLFAMTALNLYMAATECAVDLIALIGLLVVTAGVDTDAQAFGCLIKLA